MTAPPVPPGSVPPSRVASRRIWLVLRIVFPLGVLAYLFTITSIAELRAALSSVSLATLLVSTALFVAGLAAAGLRWQLLLRACGAHAVPSVAELTRLHWIGAFYGTYVPGGIGGEVVRAVATRTLFGPAGLPAAIGVVVLERALGVSALLIIVTAMLPVRPLPMISSVWPWVIGGIGAVVLGVGGILLAPKLAPKAPGPLRRLLAALPVVRSLPLLSAAIAVSIIVQLTPVITGHIVLAGIAPQVTWLESMVIMPVVLAAQFFPLTIAGAGVREAAFVAFYGLVGVAKHDALAASLVVAVLTFAWAAFGGVLQMWKPLSIEVDRP